MAPNLILQYVFGGFALVLAVAGYFRRARRAALWSGALASGAAAGAAHYDAFWPMVLFGVLAVWAMIAALDVLDLSWRLRSGLILGLCAIAFLVLWPSLHNMSGGKLPCPAYVKDHVHPRLVAGLDLRGGLRLVYTVDVDEAIKDKRDRYYEDMRIQLSKAFALHSGDDRPSEEVYKKLREKVTLEAPRRPANRIVVTFKNPADASKIDARFRDEFRADLGDPVVSGPTFTFTLREASETAIRESAVNQAKDIILRRVDELGLREAAVSTRDEDVIVEVPGEDEASFANIRDIISQTARLEFKLLDDDTDFFGPISKTAKPESLPDGIEFPRESPSVGLDESGDEKRSVTHYAFLKKKPEESSKQALQRFREWVATLELPPDRELGFELARETNPDTLKESEVGWRTYLLKSRAEITGDMIRDAVASPNQDQGSLGGWYVGLNFTDQGGRIFERITAANVKRRFAIILDNRVESAPVIQSRIPGGHASITLGSQDPEVQLRDARKLELVLRSGALPAPISPTNEQRIGPSLGRDSIELGVKGAVGGGVLVLLFMLVYYRRAGIIANVAVLMNVFLQLAILASFGAAMTLPGIAGLALTIGMSVDANVLINERIREELRMGKSARAAVEVGYGRAFSAIIDGHITTLISGVILAQYGSGPIKGFAVTLIVGVAVSIFTGVVVSRAMFDVWVRNLGRTARLDLG
ncbi:MAG TPA: protein translocase subunit SecD [Polyangiaceae bacterium]